jgi:hypothetical protein
MAENPNQKPQNDQRNAQPAQHGAPTQPAADKREYAVKHKIVQGGKDKRRTLTAGETLRLTDDEAKRLGDAVELKR